MVRAFTDEENERMMNSEAKKKLYDFLGHLFIFGPAVLLVIPILLLAPGWWKLSALAILPAAEILVYYKIYLKTYIDEKDGREKLIFFKDVSKGGQERDPKTGEILQVVPQRGIISFWGQNQPLITKQGLQFQFPFAPLNYVVSALNAVIPEDLDFFPEDIISIDGAQIFIRISVSYTVDWDDPFAVLRYIDAGGKAGVKGILDNVYPEAARAVASLKGYRECLKAGSEFSEAIAKATFGGRISTAALQKLKSGRASIPYPLVGIAIIKINVPRVALDKALAKKVEAEAEEDAQQRSELKETATIQAIIAALTTPATITTDDGPTKFPGFSATEAKEIMQSERFKVAKSIIEHQFTAKGMEPTAAGVMAILSPFMRGNIAGDNSGQQTGPGNNSINDTTGGQIVRELRNIREDSAKNNRRLQDSIERDNE